jgi:NAD(P)-dependent dehydrogenase (short-subunit alcohol dehydrogenase family)
MKTFVVTGATDGIGLETARQLLALGHRVLVHGRTKAKAEAAVAHLKGETGIVHGDLGVLSEVRALGGQIEALAPVLDGLINNAGIFAQTRTLSPDGFEMTMAVNHLAPFLLTHALLGALKKSPDARVVTVSSMAHARGRIDVNDFNFEKRFDGGAAYAASKLANICFTNELARRTQQTSITASSLHPGVITTKLLAAGFGMTGASLEQGARTTVFCATASQLKGVSGKYYSDCAEKTPASQALNAALDQELWSFSSRAVGL